MLCPFAEIPNSSSTTVGFISAGYPPISDMGGMPAIIVLAKSLLSMITYSGDSLLIWGRSFGLWNPSRAGYLLLLIFHRSCSCFFLIVSYISSLGDALFVC